MRFAPAPQYQVFPTRERPLNPLPGGRPGGAGDPSAAGELHPDAVISDILTVAPGLAAELEGRPWVTLVPHILPTPEPGRPPYSTGRACRGRASARRSGP